MIEFPNLLLVTGANRNVGKTSFICEVISRFKNLNIVGIKITPHFHNSRNDKKVILSNDEIFISEELDKTSKKDSSLMIQAGAKKVFYIEIIEDNFEEIIKLLQQIPDDIPIVCESASLRKSVKPGLMIMIDNDANDIKKPIYFELRKKIDVLVEADNLKFHFDFDRLKFGDNRWNY